MFEVTRSINLKNTQTASKHPDAPPPQPNHESRSALGGHCTTLPKKASTSDLTSYYYNEHYIITNKYFWCLLALS